MVLEKEIQFLNIQKQFTKVNIKLKKAYFKNLEQKLSMMEDKSLLPHAKIDLG
jgi:hypothetical protein